MSPPSQDTFYDTFVVPKDHPSLAGHFPGQPIVPGVVVLDRVLRAADAQGFNVVGIAGAKFRSPMPIGKTARLELKRQSDNKAYAVVSCDGKEILSVTLEYLP